MEDIERICGTCKYFRMHYILWGQSFHPLCKGHCVFPGVKYRHASVPACKHFAPMEEFLPQRPVINIISHDEK